MLLKTIEAKSGLTGGAGLNTENQISVTVVA